MDNIESMKDMYTTKELASFLKVSEQTVYSLVKREEIEPVNKEDWTIDGTYFFSTETAERLKQYYTKPGLTNKDVAERLNISLSTAQKLVKAGEIPSFTATYLGRDITFVNEEDLINYEEKHKRERKIPFYDKETQTYMFQSFTHSATGELARIIEISNHDKKVIGITERGTKLHYETLMEQGYQPSYKLDNKKSINKRGFAVFRLLNPAQLNSIVYQLIEKLIYTVGVQNCRINLKEDTIELSVKPIQLPLNQWNDEEIQLLKQSIIKGKIVERHQGILLDSDEVTIHTVIPTELKKQVQLLAKSQNVKIEEFVQQAISNYIDQIKNEDIRS
ncbi:helix-turn-helix domain-containing protein [Gracilibacillus oryzae]|uniref:Helix-turn-helix domain-containing protein n=1 Tax=Gracilibacillus oryzae TaxID=1672701 RepID=A0A7C8L0Z0_9BACI|nr:helix-turn-helix domain-containing protein [Gracilibacillus oryzae]KAB8138535.1 helix-turn-helix domain-containing protein [Gracilibacillus oryzae]